MERAFAFIVGAVIVWKWSPHAEYRFVSYSATYPDALLPEPGRHGMSSATDVLSLFLMVDYRYLNWMYRIQIGCKPRSGNAQEGDEYLLSIFRRAALKGPPGQTILEKLTPNLFVVVASH
ncbi:hypothetical protein FQN57_004764 [Myotisia sp. PD_48]|nr:hypothetical protein FQN57_004764 [Myotisia sp. PD_48]